MIPFRVAYVDPPWEFRNKKTGGSHTSGSAQQYPVLSVAWEKVGNEIDGKDIRTALRQLAIRIRT